MPVLGYTVNETKLVVDMREAQSVRHIFELYLGDGGNSGFDWGSAQSFGDSPASPDCREGVHFTESCSSLHLQPEQWVLSILEPNPSKTPPVADLRARCSATLPIA